jgi:SAM-dependent methyltransferase
MNRFYLQTLQRLLDDGHLRKDMQILVLCGETLDRDVFDSAGFENVVISNVDQRHEQACLVPYTSAYQHAESLTYEDGFFDVVVVHLGLHHCRQPHRALCEMYRVARHGVLLFEPCDSAMVRIGRWLGVGQTYEVHAVAAHDLSFGGANNTPIPNFVYRWTQREIEQTICAYAPEHQVRVRVFYHMEIHWHDLRAKRRVFPLLVAALSWPFLRALMWVCPVSANTLAAYIKKTGALHPWLEHGSGKSVQPKRAWFENEIRS